MGLNGVSSNEPLRLGVYGGAFDPPHRAHFALAKVALDQLKLDQLRVIPTGQAWHKPRALSSAADRLAMCELNFSALAKIVVDPRETLREGASYTIDTLLELRQEFPHAQLFLILGQDQADSLTTWHRWELISQLAIICVAARAHSTGDSSQLGCYSPPCPQMQNLDLPRHDVSATEIRQRIASHKSVASLVFDSVARYIEQHHLYLIT